ncbi:MAG: hypothetical protein EHM59_03545 [Betaproteobacteria bacterium]|nr:MAG: hypothetical protein EHM59_03545 [Betaproteobacteria bacterium]
MGEARGGPAPGEPAVIRAACVGRLREALTLACVLVAAGAIAAAPAEYPTKPVRLVVVYPPGGGIDILARALGQRMIEDV